MNQFKGTTWVNNSETGKKKKNFRNNTSLSSLGHFQTTSLNSSPPPSCAVRLNQLLIIVFSIVDHLNSPQNSNPCRKQLYPPAPFKRHGLSWQALTCLQPLLYPTEDLVSYEWSMGSQLSECTSFFSTRLPTSLSRFHSSSLFHPNRGQVFTGCLIPRLASIEQAPSCPDKTKLCSTEEVWWEFSAAMHALRELIVGLLGRARFGQVHSQQEFHSCRAAGLFGAGCVHCSSLPLNTHIR